MTGVQTCALPIYKEGNRIGYGGGYYDKYIHWLEGMVPAENIYKLAVTYRCQLVEIDIIESEPHDMKVDGIVTEDFMLRI